MNKVIITNSPDETMLFAQQLGKNAKPGDIFALDGELGSGKTVLARGIAYGLGITDDVTSPTFNLMEVYESKPALYHFDLYRITDQNELDNLFFEEYWESDGVSVIEWACNAMDMIPDNAYHLTIEYIDETSRRITIEHTDI